MESKLRVRRRRLNKARTIGCIRVSTDEQDLNFQKLGWTPSFGQPEHVNKL